MNSPQDPCEGLEFILGPIRELFLHDERPFMNRLECLSILEIRYTETLKAVNGNWKAYFRSDFLFFELISREKPEQIALALTKCDLPRFNNLSVQDFLVLYSKRREEIARNWKILVDDTRVCAMVSQRLGSLLNDIAHVCGYLHSVLS